MTRRSIITAVIFLFGCVIFLSAYDGVKESGDLAQLDAPTLQWVSTLRSPKLTIAMQAVTNLLSPLTLSVVTLVISALWVWRKKELVHPLLFVGAMSGAFTISSLIKHVTHRGRPPVLMMVPPFETDYSFPSGHTIGIAVFLLVLGYLLYSLQPTVRRMVTWGIVTIVGVVIVAFSRLYLGYHWMTDISASIGLALVILAIVMIVDMFTPRWTTG